MIQNPSGAEPPLLLLRDCLAMDSLVAERLRATVKVSLDWAEQMLDVLLCLDDDLQAFDSRVKQQVSSLRAPENRALGAEENRLSALEEMAQETERGVGRLRSSVLEVMMSMQNQDVIGQAMERAASALEKRSAALAKVAAGANNGTLYTNEIAKLHRGYQAEDNLHRDASFTAQADKAD